MDTEEFIRPLDSFSYALCVTPYPLAEAGHLIGVGHGPCGSVLRNFEELAILHELACLVTEYWKIYGTGSGCVCPSEVSNGRIQSLWGWRRRGEDCV